MDKSIPTKLFLTKTGESAILSVNCPSVGENGWVFDGETMVLPDFYFQKIKGSTKPIEVAVVPFSVFDKMSKISKNNQDLQERIANLKKTVNSL